MVREAEHLCRHPRHAAERLCRGQLEERAAERGGEGEVVSVGAARIVVGRQRNLDAGRDERARLGPVGQVEMDGDQRQQHRSRAGRGHRLKVLLPRMLEMVCRAGAELGCEHRSAGVGELLAVGTERKAELLGAGQDGARLLHREGSAVAEDIHLLGKPQSSHLGQQPVADHRHVVGTTLPVLRRHNMGR